MFYITTWLLLFEFLFLFLKEDGHYCVVVCACVFCFQVDITDNLDPGSTNEWRI
jgi:hypothetical protein